MDPLAIAAVLLGSLGIAGAGLLFGKRKERDEQSEGPSSAERSERAQVAEETREEIRGADRVSQTRQSEARRSGAPEPARRREPDKSTQRGDIARPTSSDEDASMTDDPSARGGYRLAPGSADRNRELEELRADLCEFANAVAKTKTDEAEHAQRLALLERRIAETEAKHIEPLVHAPKTVKESYVFLVLTTAPSAGSVDARSNRFPFTAPRELGEYIASMRSHEDAGALRDWLLPQFTIELLSKTLGVSHWQLITFAILGADQSYVRLLKRLKESGKRDRDILIALRKDNGLAHLSSFPTLERELAVMPDPAPDRAARQARSRLEQQITQKLSNARRALSRVVFAYHPRKDERLAEIEQQAALAVRLLEGIDDPQAAGCVRDAAGLIIDLPPRKNGFLTKLKATEVFPLLLEVSQGLMQGKATLEEAMATRDRAAIEEASLNALGEFDKDPGARMVLANAIAEIVAGNASPANLGGVLKLLLATPEGLRARLREGKLDRAAIASWMQSTNFEEAVQFESLTRRKAKLKQHLHRAKASGKTEALYAAKAAIREAKLDELPETFEAACRDAIGELLQVPNTRRAKTHVVIGNEPVDTKLQDAVELLAESFAVDEALLRNPPSRRVRSAIVRLAEHNPVPPSPLETRLPFIREMELLHALRRLVRSPLSVGLSSAEEQIMSLAADDADPEHSVDRLTPTTPAPPYAVPLFVHTLEDTMVWCAFRVLGGLVSESGEEALERLEAVPEARRPELLEVLTELRESASSTTGGIEHIEADVIARWLVDQMDLAL